MSDSVQRPWRERRRLKKQARRRARSAWWRRVMPDDRKHRVAVAYWVIGGVLCGWGYVMFWIGGGK